MGKAKTITTLCTVVVLTSTLTACGSGGSESAEPQPTAPDPIPLETREDVLRQLVLLNAYISTPIEIPAQEDRPESPGTGTAEATPDSGGSDGSMQEAWEESFHYELLDRVEHTYVTVKTFEGAKLASMDGSTLIYDGRIQTGHTDHLDDGSHLGYVSYGHDMQAYTLTHARESGDGSRVIERRLDKRGHLESERSGTARRRTRGWYDSVVEIGHYHARIRLGSAAVPFEINVAEEGQENWEGVYQYSSSRCVGGLARAVTETPLIRSDRYLFQAGRLRFIAGDREAIIEFFPDGKAMVVMDGQVMPVMRQEMESLARSGPPC